MDWWAWCTAARAERVSEFDGRILGTNSGSGAIGWHDQTVTWEEAIESLDRGSNGKPASDDGRRRMLRVSERVTSQRSSVQRAALYAVRYFGCNPFRYTAGTCYNPLATASTYLWNRCNFRAVASPFAVIHVDPMAIQWNLRVPARTWPLGLIHGGNWDKALRRSIYRTGKVKSMQQRFSLGYEWEETDLFRYTYQPQFLRVGGTVKGTNSISELATHYQRVYDRLYVTIQDHGFNTPTPQEPEAAFVYVHIGRDGEILYTQGGNHRLGIALALELESIPVRVISRHIEWQRIREEAKAGTKVIAPYFDHPDLNSLVQRGEGSGWPGSQVHRPLGRGVSR